MLARNSAERPERVLQAFGERNEALATKHDMGMFEAGIGELKIVETVVERLPGDGDAGAAHVGEIRQAYAAGPVHLPEDNLLLLAMDGAPGSDATLDRAANGVAQFGVTAQHLLEDGDRLDAGRNPR